MAHKYKRKSTPHGSGIWKVIQLKEGCLLGKFCHSEVSQYFSGPYHREEKSMALCFDSRSLVGATANIPTLLFATAASAHCTKSKEKDGNKNDFVILVVEDDLVNSIAVAKLLEKCGHQVYTACNGQEAVELVKSTRFDLILMDIEMPVMDGLQATKIIRGTADAACPANVPIVAMTGHTMKGDKERFLKAGVDSVLSKPFYVSELQGIIASMLR